MVEKVCDITPLVRKEKFCRRFTCKKKLSLSAPPPLTTLYSAGQQVRALLPVLNRKMSKIGE